MKTIIVPVDFSEFSEYSLEAAAALARKTGANILTVHMLELATVHAYGSDTMEDRMSRGIYFIKRAEQEFDLFLDKPFLEGIKVTPIIRQFKVFSELGEVAKENHADLIVMGSSGISGIFVGSNTEKVVRHSKVPVLVVKKKPTHWKLNKVIFATDFSDSSIPALQKATKMLQSFNPDFKILNVSLPGDSFREREDLNAEVENFLLKADGNLNRLSQVHYITDRSAEDGILKYARREDADLIVITTHGRTGLSRFFQGSISEDLANHGNFPILTFRREDAND